MASQDNISLVRKFFDYLNQNDPNKVNACDSLLAPNMQMHDPFQTSMKTPNQSVKQAESEYIRAFPNKKCKIDSIFSASDDQVVVRWTCTGTHKGEFCGLSPTNKNFTISGISIYRISNNKIAEAWQVWDRFALFEQIGELHLAHALHR